MLVISDVDVSVGFLLILFFFGWVGRDPTQVHGVFGALRFPAKKCKINQ